MACRVDETGSVLDMLQRWTSCPHSITGLARYDWSILSLTTDLLEEFYLWQGFDIIHDTFLKKNCRIFPSIQKRWQNMIVVCFFLDIGHLLRVGIVTCLVFLHICHRWPLLRRDSDQKAWSWSLSNWFYCYPRGFRQSKERRECKMIQINLVFLNHPWRKMSSNTSSAPGWQ